MDLEDYASYGVGDNSVSGGINGGNGNGIGGGFGGGGTSDGMGDGYGIDLSKWGLAFWI